MSNSTFLKRLFGTKSAPTANEVSVSAVMASPTATRTDFTRLKVAGESHYQDALLAICGSQPGEEVKHECFAQLVPEPENPYDANAVRVEIEGQPVGHLTRSEAAEWQPRLIELEKGGVPIMCHAFAGCMGASSGNPNIGVSLEIPVNYA